MRCLPVLSSLFATYPQEQLLARAQRVLDEVFVALFSGPMFGYRVAGLDAKIPCGQTIQTSG
jgi:hypothetical protein